MICHLCQGKIRLFDNFCSLIQVTSDCRPWKNDGKLGICESCSTVQKPITEDWTKDANEIYSKYQIYSQSGGIEQSTFDQSAGASSSRSFKIVQWLSTTGLIPENGKLLDIGCGNGAFLKAFGRHYTSWKMTGLELDSRSKDVILSIPGVVNLHTELIEELYERFDLIVLIHALEHIPNPIQYLNSLKKYLNPGGLLFIEVPDLETSPFDILIADHSTHFVADILNKVIESAGFETLTLKSDFVPKELSLLAKDDTTVHEIVKGIIENTLISTEEIAKSHISWLQQLLKQGQECQGTIGIFGTSISATWLTASLGNKISFFVDEDINRIGHTHMGLPIFGANNSPENSFILVPLRSDIAKLVSQRLSETNLQFILPSD